ncbi:MAG TPA: hypothetical protein VF579_02795 [Candidatus Methylomirabilis sp.]
MADIRSDTPRAEPCLGWRLAVTFAVVALLFFAPSPQSMALNILDLAMSLVDHGSLELHEHRGVDIAMRDGKVLSGMPPGASFVAAGVYFLARPALLLLLPPASRLTALNLLCTLLIGLPAAAATVYLVYRICLAWGTPRRNALLTAALFGFGTMHFGYATGYDKKILAGFCLLWAFWLLVRLRTPTLGWSRALAAGALTGLAIGQDYPTVAIALPLGGYLLTRHPRPGALLAFVGASGVALLPILIYHQMAFGSPWVTAYQFRTEPTGNTVGFPQAEAFLFLLVTLTASSPCLLWSARGWWRTLRARQWRAEMWTVAGVVGTTLLLISCWVNYYPHDASFPSRLILPLVPFAALPAVFGLPERLDRAALAVIAWSVGTTLLATQATLIPTGTIPPVYALKVLGTSWGAGPFFSETLGRWLGLPTLHLLISQGAVSARDLLHAKNHSLLVAAILGQALIKTLSLLATIVAGAMLWWFVWRPVLHPATTSPSQSITR